MRAVERDRLIARLAWVYLVALAGVLAFFLWPRTLPEGPRAVLDFSELAVAKKLDFAAVDRLDMRLVATTKATEDRTRSVVATYGGDAGQLSVPIDKDEERLFSVLAALRQISHDDRRVTLILRFAPGGQLVELHRGAFDDPGGTIGRRLYEREKAVGTSTTVDETETSTR